ncbi:MAG: polysaccharide biosynthesis protein [Silvanigrellales bacterium]|jgi:FlaA1/EpsC-like NDP-sugar epimerase|nr:polysaccharide biosynthesis protein [Silvanigrellales bacterium]
MTITDLKQRYLRRAALLAADAMVVLATLPLALFLRLDPAEAVAFLRQVGADYYALLLLLSLACSYTVKSHLAILRLANLFTALRVAGALLLCFGLFHVFAVFVFAFEPTLPRSTILIQALLAIPVAVGLRFSFRILERFAFTRDQEGKRTLIYGAGLTTDRILPMMLRSPDKYVIVGLLDDNPGKRGAEVQGVRVLGGRGQLASLVKRHEVEQVILAMPSLPGKELRGIVRDIRACGASAKILPDPDAFLQGNTTRALDVRDLDIADLLRRPPRNLDRDAIRATLQGKVVLVTGGGGSIGSELCRQVALAQPSVLVVNDASEFALYRIHQELLERFPNVRIVTSLGDVADTAFTHALFNLQTPQIVFHACAYKHVPLCEENIVAAFRNNVGSALRVFEAAVRCGVERVVLISSDKAVRPTNVMGATKRLCELLTLWYAQHASDSRTRFYSVRFGNVLGSSGSVIPRFLEQIRAGGPVTVTHPDMTRYFLLIPEAASLVLQAVANAKAPGDIYVLNMGEPVRIVDLARDLISLMGYAPDEEIPIAFTGMRPGEKMYEELSLEGETMESVNDDYARITNLVAVPPSLLAEVEDLSHRAFEMGGTLLAKKLFALIQRFESIENAAKNLRESSPNV